MIYLRLLKREYMKPIMMTLQVIFKKQRYSIIHCIAEIPQF